MPHKFEIEKIKLNEKTDRRIKLTQEDKEEIRKMYASGLVSQRELARIFNVSRRSIQFAINPDKYRESLEQLKERQKDGRYYDKEKHTEYVRNYRRYKADLYKKGELA